jgi:hypothetical protein
MLDELPDLKNASSGSMRLIRGLHLQRSGCICLATTVLFITISLFLVVGAKYAQYNQNPALSPFLEYMLASGTTTSNTSINSQCSPYECSVPLTPGASVDETVPQKENQITSIEETVPPEDDWKFKFGRDDRDLALDDQGCDTAFPGFYGGTTRATQFRGNRVIMLEELASIKI